MKSIAIISPVKNEQEVLPHLIDAVENQTIPISLWIFVNDNSSDNTEKILKRILPTLKNVKKTLIVPTEGLDEKYALGMKYSKVVNFGFSRLRQYQLENDINYDYIGLIDADCVPNPNFFKKLLEKFAVLKRLGIASGIHYYSQNGEIVFQKSPRRFPSGNCRLWRRECFEQCGYILGMSADALSTAAARLKGWETQAFYDVSVYAREYGKKFNLEYYGKSAYYRYVPFYFITIRCIILSFRDFHGAKVYFQGYLSASKEKNRGEFKNRKIIRYFRFLPYQIILENIIVIKNLLILKFQKKD